MVVCWYTSIIPRKYEEFSSEIQELRESFDKLCLLFEFFLKRELTKGTSFDNLNETKCKRDEKESRIKEIV